MNSSIATYDFGKNSEIISPKEENPLAKSQQSPLAARRQCPTSPMYMGDYEMQTDLDNDLIRMSTVKKDVKRRRNRKL